MHGRCAEVFEAQGQFQSALAGAGGHGAAFLHHFIHLGCHLFDLFFHFADCFLAQSLFQTQCLFDAFLVATGRLELCVLGVFACRFGHGIFLAAFVIHTVHAIQSLLVIARFHG